MKVSPFACTILLGLSAAFWGKFANASLPHDEFSVVKDNVPSCKVVIITDDNSEGLLKRSADQIADTVQFWSGAKLPRTILKERKAELPADRAIILATLSALTQNVSELPATQQLGEVAKIDPQGFAIIPLDRNGTRQLLIVSQTARGVFNGTVYLKDFCIDGTKDSLTVDCSPVVRSPKLGGRAIYNLTIWGNEAEYTPADWEKVFERFSRDGVDRIYFWVSGHFPSKKFPQTYRSKTVEGGKTFDTTVNSKIGSVEDLQAIVRSAHKLGLKIYLGGGLGCWCGTMFLTDGAAETLKRGPKEPSLCPSNAQVRRALVEYYQELFDALPEADGLFIESADEVGACTCEACGRSLDKFGSKQFGQAQLSLCQEIMDAVWRDHPHARLAYTIGYPEHASDVAYYKRIKQWSQDPRLEWMEARGSWTFPGPQGEPKSPAYFSDHVMRWKEYHTASLEDMIGEANRIGQDKMYGMILSFSPGFTSGSFYKDIPFPTDILPYALTGLVYREMTWDPTLTKDRMQQLSQQRFFGKEAPDKLAADLWKLREMIRTRKGMKDLPEIEAHIQEAAKNASPKTSDGLKLMTRAIDDLRKYPTNRSPR